MGPENIKLQNNYSFYAIKLQSRKWLHKSIDYYRYCSFDIIHIYNIKLYKTVKIKIT